ncbi:GYD domain-containing protein [Pseudonocardia halophobica]|uniref:GYD domain-containing protein n=1 Tax=Pseudonocardia halophobica TaxID=29401 RepID=UPI003D933C6A
MTLYMMQMIYTNEAWTALVKDPEDRALMARSLAEDLGGTNVGFWLSLGEHDLVTIFDLPDQASAAALSMAISAGGAVSDVKTTVLMSPQEAVRAMNKAQSLEYRPPRAMWAAREDWSDSPPADG